MLPHQRILLLHEVYARVIRFPLIYFLLWLMGYQLLLAGRLVMECCKISMCAEVHQVFHIYVC